MKKVIRDGWHKIADYDVYVENGRVIRGTSQDGQRTVYPYRACKSGGWDNDSGLTVAAFRAGAKRGTIEMK